MDREVSQSPKTIAWLNRDLSSAAPGDRVKRDLRSSSSLLIHLGVSDISPRSVAKLHRLRNSQKVARMRLADRSDIRTDDRLEHRRYAQNAKNPQ